MMNSLIVLQEAPCCAPHTAEHIILAVHRISSSTTAQ